MKVKSKETNTRRITPDNMEMGVLYKCVHKTCSDVVRFGFYGEHATGQGTHKFFAYIEGINNWDRPESVFMDYHISKYDGELTLSN